LAQFCRRVCGVSNVRKESISVWVKKRAASKAERKVAARGESQAAAAEGAARGRAAARRLVLEAAYRKHPERFVRQPPAPLRLPAAVWINPPAQMAQNSSCCPGAEKTSRTFDPQAICLPAPDALDGPESNATGEIQSVATVNSIVQLSQNR
jgi:hypothetical protein